MRILLSNDDGINAPGLKTLEKIARELSDDVWIVAPELDQSGASHSLTLHDPLRIREISHQKFAVNGTPTDCVLMCVNHMLKNSPPQLILSGVNYGVNIAEDVTYSGTIAAAMEGVLLGIPSIAMSLEYSQGHPVKWATAEHHGSSIIRKLLEAKIPSGIVMNVNFPNVIASSVTGVKITHQGLRQIDDNLIERMDPRGKPYYWIGSNQHRKGGGEGTDLDAIASGSISITPLTLNLTHVPTVSYLQEAFNE